MVTSSDDLLNESLMKMGSVVFGQQPVESILDLVTVLTARTVGSARAVGITMGGTKGPYTSNATGEVARTLDQAQYAAGRGPCVQVLEGEGDFVNERLVEAGGEWPEFSTAAQVEEVHSVMSVPLRVREQTVGVLNIYGAEDRPFTGDEETTGRLLAEQAAIVVANAMAFAGAEELNSNLERAVQTRDLIGQAKGILMARQGCSAEEAFDVLRRASQRTNRKLHEIAATIVDSVARRAGP